MPQRGDLNACRCRCIYNLNRVTLTFVMKLFTSTSIPANTKHSSSAGLMLAQRRRRWANIKLTLVKCHVFAGIQQHSFCYAVHL